MKLTNDNYNPSKSYYQAEKLDLDSWFQVTQIDYEKLIEEYSFNNLFKGFAKNKLKLLDIGCGTAKFPSLLDKKLEGDIHISADLLDISEYCLQVAQKQFDSCQHFSINKTYLSGTENLQQLVEKTNSYDIIWAIHSLCTVDPNRMADVYLYCLDLLGDNGKFLIYQLAEKSSYNNLYSFYLSHYAERKNTTYFLTSEDHKQILDTLGINYENIRFRFSHRINFESKNILEIYLKKCVFDNTLDVLNFFQPILQESFDRETNQYQFEQIVDLLIIDEVSNI
ncbi:MAG: class I SAM-dependent methyltransferase [Okeania sp. SIO2G4]|uniref:class I SAM-dependent methyltransferase n=1 Tax=unclassified Okeania TaxID=2634635 RepID=UPI0013B6F7DF|nr:MULTISPECIES: class I SAM-dependent methyltransferase [unclassified Okeania]NEP06358.1 class I SAM-dependent methyltransferase [Okeania sp. SIO4D6]NEP38134.1 class I SAM-dependent methyltransferase [Okeania sp. SIO2H7]NEP71732.1 class I SAM-dependent methyltransferase [Okeania sp. SIO2G5]NEP92496.1 class I SAM-dependent methyltransferase [Okeania sp. SIO2F5]NEQ90432.1 class I SAM-dependent methyltransferase [Okeania sp. SIO2G4]